MANEIWKPLPGFGERYLVSNHGRVKLIKGGKNGKKVKILSSFLASGYRIVKLFCDGETYTKGIHQLVALAFVGPCPEGHEVNHIDGNKLNNAPDNLEYLTRAENIKHADDHNLRWWKSGSQHGRAKLTEKDVEAIRVLIHKRNMYLKDIAALYDVSPATISFIKSRKTWVSSE